MALFTAKQNTWIFAESVNNDDFTNPRFEYTARYDLHADNHSSVGICWDGTYFWVADLTPDRVYKYNSSWVFQSYFALHANNLSARGIEWDGTYFYVIDVDDNLVYKYNSSGVYQNTHAFHANNDHASGIHWDGTYFYITDFSDNLVYKYNSSWVFQSTHALTGANDFSYGISSDGVYFYVIDFADDQVYKYDSSWTYKSVYDLHVDNTDGYGICWDGTYFYISDALADDVFKHDPTNINKTIGGHSDSMILYDETYDVWAAAHETGNIEFWLRAIDAADSVGIILEDATGNSCIDVRIDTDKIIGDGSDALDPALDFIWYRIRIDFDCTPNTYDLYVDGVLKLDDKAFGTNDDGSGLTQLTIKVNTDENGLIDGIGYDWDGDYSVGDNADDTIDVTDNIIHCKIVEEIGMTSYADLQIKTDSVDYFEGGHKIEFLDDDATSSWSGIILYPEDILEGSQIIGSLRVMGLDFKFDNIYRKNFTTVRDSEYILKNIIDNALTKYHSYDDEIDNFTVTYKYDLKSKISKIFLYQSMLERAIIHYKPDGEIFFNKYDNLTATGLSWDQDTTKIKIKNYTPNANRHVTRVPVIGANNSLGQVYYVGTGTEDEEDQYGINELQAWRDPEITNYTEAKQLGDNLQTIYSINTQMISMIVFSKKHIQVGYTIELGWTGAYSITKDDFLVTKRIWYPMNDMCEIELTDNTLTRKAFNVKVTTKSYDEDAQQSYEEPDVAESTTAGTVVPLASVAEMRAAFKVMHMIGVANAAYIPCTLETSNATSTLLYTINTCNWMMRTSASWLSFLLSKPTNLGNYKLYITKIKIVISRADLTDYLDYFDIVGIDGTVTCPFLYTNGTNRTAAGTYIYTFPATVDCSSYNAVRTRLLSFITSSDHLIYNDVSMECYYDI